MIKRVNRPLLYFLQIIFQWNHRKIFIKIKELPIPGWATSIPILFQKALQQIFYNTIIVSNIIVQNSKYVNKTKWGKVSNNQNGNLRWHLPWRGGGLERVPHTYSEKWFFWKPFRIIPRLLKRVLHLVWALYYVYIVVEMTLNMAK